MMHFQHSCLEIFPENSWLIIGFCWLILTEATDELLFGDR
jgi:hypothetical protein